jgi:ABC-type sugar transport system ATPase subunit
MSPALEVRGLRKRFGAVTALAGLDFEVQPGEFFCIVGPTNAGKSTLLQTIAGLHKPDAGRIRLRGRDVTALEPRHRGVSLQFQNVALFPGLTGYENIAFPLRTAGWSAAEIERSVAWAADLLGIGHVLQRHPRTFSGGEQQRVGIGRALVHPADLLMLDEPLTNLDARIRIGLRVAFKQLHQDTGRTELYVTHDHIEAMSLSDRIAVLNEGQLQQIGTPDEIYHRPANSFVAGFVGSPPMNILVGGLTRENGHPTLVGSGFRAAVPDLDARADADALPRDLGLGVRAEEIRVQPRQSAETPFRAEVYWVEHLGSRAILDVRLGDQDLKVLVPPDHRQTDRGAVWLGFDARAERLLDRTRDRFLR